MQAHFSSVRSDHVWHSTFFNFRKFSLVVISTKVIVIMLPVKAFGEFETQVLQLLNWLRKMKRQRQLAPMTEIDGANAVMMVRTITKKCIVCDSCSMKLRR